MKIDYDLCVDCMVCVDEREVECPVNALSKKDNKAILDCSKCTNCGICVSVCPVEAII